MMTASAERGIIAESIRRDSLSYHIQVQWAISDSVKPGMSGVTAHDTDELEDHRDPPLLRSARRQIQEQIEAYNERISLLTTQLHTYSPIGTFPPEILAEIFLQYAHLYEEDEEHDLKNQFTNKSYRWLPITHICQRWREIALSTPRLWSRIAVNAKNPLMDLVFRRSKEAPIVLKANILGQQPEKTAKFLEILHDHTQRLCSLDLRCYQFKLQPKELTLENPSPLLRSLSLVSVDTRDIEKNAVKLLLSHPTPLLEYLEIMNKIFIWEPTAFRPSLRFVRLGSLFGGFAVQGSRYPSAPQFMTALRAMPLLEELFLENVFPRPNSTLSRTEIVTLPNLKRLRLMGSAKECTFFLQHTTFPYDTTLDFLLKSLRDTQDLIEHFEPAMRARVNPPPEPVDDTTEDVTGSPRSSDDGTTDVSLVPPIRSFAVRTLSQRAVQLQGWANIRHIDNMENEDDLRSFRFKIIVEGTVFSPANLLETLARELPLSKVRVLTLDRVSDITRPIWLNTLAQMTELDTLCLKEWSGEYVPEVLLAQQLRDPVLPGHSHTIAIFPKLRTIVLDNVNFGVALPGKPNLETGRFFHRFVTCLATRKQRDANTAIRKLIIRKAVNFDNTQRDMFVPWVEEIEWDRVVELKPTVSATGEGIEGTGNTETTATTNH